MKPITGLDLLNFLKAIPEKELSEMGVYIQNNYVDYVLRVPEIRTFKDSKEKGLILYPSSNI